MLIQEIRSNVEELTFDAPGVMDTFSRRLGRENAWSQSYVARVVREYRRFLLLAATTEEIVTPSDAVDQAWHLHMIHTRDYRRACKRLFGQMLDHTPSKGGRAEREKFETAYARTLVRYKDTFGEQPPSDVWPSIEERFACAHFIRVDRGGHWVIAKPWFVQFIATRWSVHSWTPWTIALVTASGMITTGCVLRHSSVPHTGPEFVLWLIAGWLMSLLLAILVRKREENGGAAECESRKLDAYEAAYLARNGRAAVDAAVALLVARRVASFDAESGMLQALAPTVADAHPFELLVLERLSTETPVALASLRDEAEAMTLTSRGRLNRLGLTAPEPSKLPFLLAQAAPVVGAVRIVSRVGTPHPVGGLVFICIAGFLLAFVAFRPAVRTWKGTARLKELKHEYEALTKGTATNLLALGMVPAVVGLFGLGFATNIPELQGLQSWSKREAKANGEGSCSGGCGDGGCGDGGCGGGCGGCGGCE